MKDTGGNGNKKNKKNRVRTIVLNLLIVIFASTFIYSAYQIWSINNNYVEEEKVHEEVLEFKPVDNGFDETTIEPSETAATQDPAATGNPAAPSATPKPIKNPSIADAQNKLNKDIVGWITVPNTKIDYPFVQSADNDYYLHRDINQRYKKGGAGTLFIDYRCPEDFSAFNTIIYGHHMKNGSMFGTLRYFREKKFFEANQTGKLFLADRSCKLEIFAYIVVGDTDSMMYNTINATAGKVTEYMEYVKDKATYFRDIGINETDHIVTLSTCGYDFEDARLIVLARVA